MKQEITCDKCDGSGRMPLPEALSETLAKIPKHGSRTAGALAKEIVGVSDNAQSNRLDRLRKLGFVKRERAGKFWRYSRA